MRLFSSAIPSVICSFKALCLFLTCSKTFSAIRGSTSRISILIGRVERVGNVSATSFKPSAAFFAASGILCSVSSTGRQASTSLPRLSMLPCIDLSSSPLKPSATFSTSTSKSLNRPPTKGSSCANMAAARTISEKPFKRNWMPNTTPWKIPTIIVKPSARPLRADTSIGMTTPPKPSNPWMTIAIRGSAAMNVLITNRSMLFPKISSFALKVPNCFSAARCTKVVSFCATSNLARMLTYSPA